jgi:hypothetical protein
MGDDCFAATLLAMTAYKDFFNSLTRHDLRGWVVDLDGSEASSAKPAMPFLIV